MPPRDKPEPADWHEVQLELHKLLVHDLKNPISALTSNLSYLESSLEGRDEDLHQAVSDCIVASKILLRMVENLGAIAALEAGEPRRSTDASVSDLVRGAVARARELCALGETQVEISDDLPEVLGSWEIQYLELALDNLILCSVANAPPGSRVDVGAVIANGAARFNVCDDGEPVVEEHRDLVFDRSYQGAAKSAGGARYGRALGLYAAGLAARHLGGRVAAGAGDDGRAEFELNLPLGD
jgi:K+-sensing histidine kinase KdpD